MVLRLGLWVGNKYYCFMIIRLLCEICLADWFEKWSSVLRRYQMLDLLWRDPVKSKNIIFAWDSYLILLSKVYARTNVISLLVIIKLHFWCRRLIRITRRRNVAFLGFNFVTQFLYALPQILSFIIVCAICFQQFKLF